MSQEKQLFSLLKKVAVRCGKIALPYYGKIASTEKHFHTEGKTRISPVTAIDFGLQELILAELMREGYAGEIGFNGEEETPLQFFFPLQSEGKMTVHCDPIDGTVSFVNGKNRFAVGMGLSVLKKEKHHFFATVIYDPLADHLYWALRGKASEKNPRTTAPKVLYAGKTFTEKGRKEVMELGYTFAFPGNAHLGITDIALQRAAAYIHHPIHVHDAMIPFAFAHAFGLTPYINGMQSSQDSFTLSPNEKTFTRLESVAYLADKRTEKELNPILSNPEFSMIAELYK